MLCEVQHYYKYCVIYSKSLSNTKDLLEAHIFSLTRELTFVCFLEVEGKWKLVPVFFAAWRRILGSEGKLEIFTLLWLVKQEFWTYKF